MLATLLPTAVLAAPGELRTRPVENQAGLGSLGLRETSAKVVEAEETIADDQLVDIIVLLDDSKLKDAAVSETVRRQMRAQQASVQAEISRQVLNGAPLEVGYVYTTLTNGFSATVTYGQLKEIRELPGVESAFLAPSFALMPSMSTSNSMIGGGIFNETGYHGEGMRIAILDTGVDMNHEIFRDAPERPSLTQAELQSILDNHALQCESIVYGVGASTLYRSEKIPFQFDYGEKDADGSPPASGGEHGTHVAATAAGNDGVRDGVMGVAPEAQILNMKVFNTSGGASYDDVLAALEDCIALDVDAVNLSLGSTCGFIDYESQDAWTMNLIQVFNRVGEYGISMAVAVGNDYSAAYNNSYGGRALTANPDYGNAGEPATYDESLAIASVENCGILSPYITVADRDICYYDGYDATTGAVTKEYAFRKLAGGQLPYVMVPGTGLAEDYQGLEVQGKIAVVQRGGSYYEAKARAAQEAGAIGLIVYNNQPGMVYMSISAWCIPVAFISQADGAFLAQQEEKVLTIATQDAVVTSPVAGMSDFSSWGATSELTLKPELSAPGGNIYSAVPGNQYELMSGTSMASPHVAGGMAIVKGAVEHRFPALTPGEQKDMIDTLLMCTASIVYDGDTPVSPRKQGAGLMDINAAAETPAYLTVAGMERPKLELMDDPQRTGIYQLNFTVHNTSDQDLSYRAYPIVITDDSTTYTTADGQSVQITTETSVPLEHTYTTNWENDLVTVPAGGEAEVSITVTLTDPEGALAAFENGAYVEGWAVLEPENVDDIALHVPFLAFYGDWTEAPSIDAGFYYEELNGETSKAQTYPNSAICSSLEGYTNTYLGDNNYALGMEYLADRNAISPNEDDFMDSLTYVYTGLLRSARNLRYTITGSDGTVYYTKTVEYEPKSVYDSSYFQVVPAGVNDYDEIDPWYGTDARGSTLPNNAKATVRIEADLVFNGHEANNKRSSWAFPITIDTQEPEITEMTVRESEGRYYATLTMTDNQYVSAVVLTDPKHSKEFDVIGLAEPTPGATTVLRDVDITGMGESIGLVIHDYAGNSKAYTLKAKGNSDDYADVVPTDILWAEDFNDAWLPEGWSIQSKGQSIETWYRDEDYMATCNFDENFPQDEWLITPAIDISGRQTEVHMVFDFNTVYAFTTYYKHCNLLVMASQDGGENWEEIWNLWDAGIFADWTNTQAKVTIPEEFQGSGSLQFAFVYQGQDGAMISIDNVVVYADLLEDYAVIHASAGENGAVSPAGDVLVKKGNSRTITITPDEGYAIAAVTVDGVDLGPISYYTFERVGVDHTIAASFVPASAAGQQTLLDQDFEHGVLPDKGWTVKTTDTGAKYYTWYVSKYTHLNGSYAARVDCDLYDEDTWSGGAKQDEYLISPSVELPNDAATLTFDYAFGRSALFGGRMSFAVEVSTDGGNTWIPIWDAAGELTDAGTGAYQTGTCSLALPEQYWGQNVQLAFHYGKNAGAYGDTVAVDNVKLTAPGGGAEVSHTLRAQATEGGTITPAGDTQVATGGSQTFVLTPAERCRLVSLQVNGRTVKAEDSYTLSDIDQSYYLLATFASIAETPQVIFEQDFEGEEFPPAGWSVEGVNGDFTWKQYKYVYLNGTQNAYISADYTTGAAQDERLVTPAVDLTGTTQTQLDFAYAYPYYGMKGGEFTFTLEVSLDGSSWTELWNAADTLPSSLTDYVVSGVAQVEIPEEFCAPDVRFAFRYTRPAGDGSGIAAVDDLKLSAVGAPVAEGHTIYASAGQGGSIAPSGTVIVPENGNQTFRIVPETGYEIADVLVDGQSVGAVDQYTFSNVTQGHTISATFRATASGILFAQDFEDGSFPSRGWQVKSSNESYTWYGGNFTQLNATKVARIDCDLYESGDWGKQEFSPAGTGAKQDEYLISPVVNLTGKTPVLQFDYAFGRYELFAGAMDFTVEASTDGGETWQTIWNAAIDLTKADSGYYQSGTCRLPVPEAFQTENVQFAFHYGKGWGSSAETVAVDNITLEEPETCIHGSTELRGATEATCTQNGYTGDTYCTICGMLLEKGETIPALGHDFAVKLETVLPTCTEDGYTRYQCSRCDATQDRDIVAAAGHTEELRNEKAPTCTEDGYTGDVYCAVCGQLLEKGQAIAPNGHQYSQSVTEPTCTEGGYTTHTCTVCGHSYRDSETLPLGHSFRDTVVAPACGREGYTEHLCTVCGYSCRDQYTPALSHSWSSWKTEQEAGCTQPGVKTRTCAICGQQEKDTISATGHSYTETVTQPTCETVGYTTYTCAACGHSYVDHLIPATGHHYVSQVTLPTCGEMGYTTYTCSVCGYSYRTDYVQAHDHHYEATVTKEATCTEEGILTFTCTECGESYRENIPMAPHDYNAQVIQPDCSHMGYTMHTCTVCGHSYQDSFVDAKGHTYQAEEVPATCTGYGFVQETCTTCGDSYISAITPPSGHMVTRQNAKAATCTEEGYTGDEICTVCSETVKQGEVIPAMGHKTVVQNAKPATCLESGYTGDQVCTVCGKTVAVGEVIPASCPSEAFTDLNITKWYHEYTDYVITNDLMNGMGGNLFAPNHDLTRAMLVTTLYRLAGEPAVAEKSGFQDVAENAWYTDAVAWAEAVGIAQGVTDTKFNPMGKVTREQAAAFLYRFVTEYLKAEPASGADLAVYTDAGSISGYARTAVAWATAEELFQGFPDGSVQPQGTLTRAQMAKLLAVLAQRF